MPSAIIKIHILGYLTCSINQAMCRHPKCADLGKIRMTMGIQFALKKIINITAAKLLRRQADVMNNQ